MSRLIRFLTGCLLGFLLLCSPSDVSAAAAAVLAGTESIHVVGRLVMNLTLDQENEFEKKTLELAKITRNRDPVASYSSNRDIEHPGTYVFDEIWPSQQALVDHLNTPHFLAWWDWVKPHLSHDLDVQIAPTDAFHSL